MRLARIFFVWTLPSFAKAQEGQALRSRFFICPIEQTKRAPTPLQSLTQKLAHKKEPIALKGSLIFLMKLLYYKEATCLDNPDFKLAALLE